MKSSTTKPLTRTIALVAAICILASSATFAALQSQDNVLSGNTIQTATANLKLSKDGQHFNSTQTGFSFNDLIPGGAPSPATGYKIYLSNAGGTLLSLKLAVSSTPTNPNNVDLSKVHVVLTGRNTLKFSIADLISNYQSGGVSLDKILTVGETQQYSLQVAMDADAITGAGASLDNLDISFSAKAIN